jgi:hypothetical protein
MPGNRSGPMPAPPLPTIRPHWRHDGRLVRCDVERMQRRGDGLGRHRARAEWTERNLRGEQAAAAHFTRAHQVNIPRQSRGL